MSFKQKISISCPLTSNASSLFSRSSWSLDLGMTHQSNDWTVDTSFNLPPVGILALLSRVFSIHV